MDRVPAPLAVTLGDPSGVGPELVVEAWRSLNSVLPFVVVGSVDHVRDLNPDIPIRALSDPSEWSASEFCVIDVPLVEPAHSGTPQPANAAAVIDSIARAVAYCQSGKASALVTAPINKAVLVEGAEFPHPGHTEFLADLDGKHRSVMMLAGPDLRVVPVTIHCALKDVPSLLTPDLLRETISITARALRTDFGITAPRIAVAGLNPHAGENGLMGQEEAEFIAPLLDKMRAEGLDLAGPMSADTMFHARTRESYDCAVCMYHDQALIPIKTLAFDEGVNVTLGLTFVRTSPDHGTAFDIAGKGIARADSLIAAMKLAGQLAANRS